MDLLYLIFGYIGGFLLCISFIPQVYHVYKEKDVKALSNGFLILQFITCLSMSVYSTGFILNNDMSGLPLLVSNIFIIICVILLIYAKYKYQRSPSQSSVSNK